jgi:hypothetical protein
MFLSVYSNRNLKIIQMQSKVFFFGQLLPFYFRVLVFRNESHSKTKCKFIVPAKTTMCTSKSGLVSKMERKDFIFIFVEIKKFLSHYD